MSLSTTTHKSPERAGGTAPAKLLGTPTRWAWLAICVIIIAFLFLVISDDWLQIINYTLIAAIVALALNVLSGYAGQVSLGIAFFMAIGAYTAAWLGGTPPTDARSPLGLGLSIFIWLPAAGIVAALAGALIGPTALRLKGFYLGIVSLALIFIGQYIFKNATGLTGGPQGRSFPVPTFGAFSFATPKNDLFGVAVSKEQEFFLLLVPIVVLTALFVGNVIRSRAGRAFQAVRDNEVGASIMGINLFEAKMGAFMLSSFLAGIAGALYASYTRYIEPSYWDLTLSIQFVAAIIVGGIASVWGSILGAAFVFALPRVLDQFSLLPQNNAIGGIANGGGIASGDLNALIYGLLVIAFLLFQPEGIMGLVRRGQALVRRFTARKGEGGEPAEITDLPVSDLQAQNAPPGDERSAPT